MASPQYARNIPNFAGILKFFFPFFSTTLEITFFLFKQHLIIAALYSVSVNPNSTKSNRREDPFTGAACELGECPPGHRLHRNAEVAAGVRNGTIDGGRYGVLLASHPMVHRDL
jgi:hypothetical protein